MCSTIALLLLFSSLPATPLACLQEDLETPRHPMLSWVNCTTASFGWDTRSWCPMLCKSASRPSQPLDAASCCDPFSLCVMCSGDFPTIRSLVRYQGKTTNHRQLPPQAHMQPRKTESREPLSPKTFQTGTQSLVCGFIWNTSEMAVHIKKRERPRRSTKGKKGRE